MKSSSSPIVRRDRRRGETKSSSSSTSKWETSAPVVATSKWDNIDPETESNEPSRKKSKAKHDEDIFADLDMKQKGVVSDEDLDGAPLDSSPEATRHSSGSKYYYYNTLDFSRTSLKYFVCLRNEDQRGKLRELELKVVRYQDELEAGLHNQILGMSVSEQVQQYREHLLRKVKDNKFDYFLLYFSTMFFTGQIFFLFPLHSQNAIVHKKEVMAANANLHANGARLTVPRNRIVLVAKELTENVIKKKIDDVQFPDQGLVPDRPESNSKTTFDI